MGIDDYVRLLRDREERADRTRMVVYWAIVVGVAVIAALVLATG